MTQNTINRNETFLRNLYARGPFQGHAFTCTPKMLPICKHPDYDFTISDKPVENWLPWIIDDYKNHVRMTEEVGDDSVPFAKLPTSTHIYAAAFGCEVHRFVDSNACAIPMLNTAAEARKLTKPDIWKSPTLYRIFELAHAVQNELGKDVYLGPPDVQSGFDTASLIWDKTDFLCAMMDEEEKEAIKHLVDICADLLKDFLTAFRREFPQASPCHCPIVWAPPEMGPWLSNDECGAFSTEMFEELCLPELVDLAETFGGLGMHCCAAAEHQFESFKKIPNFYAFNRVAAAEGYYPLLDYFGGDSAPVHVLGWVGEKVIKNLITKAPERTRFIFNKPVKDDDEARQWLDEMRTLSPRV